MNVMGSLATVSLATYGLHRLMAPAQSGSFGRRFTLWDGLMATHMLPVAAQVAMQRQATLAIGKTKSDEGHHTIPKYLCGSPSQELSFVPYVTHKMLHGGLSAMTVLIEATGGRVDRLIPVALGWRTKTAIRTLGEVQNGRGAIASAIGQFYQLSQLGGVGRPRSVMDVFLSERNGFVGLPSNSPCALD